MKQIYSTLMMLALMVAALSFTACGDDSDENEYGSPDSFIIGTWECVYAEGWGLEDDEDGLEFIQYKPDRTYLNVQIDEEFDGGLYVSKGTWEIKDDVIIMKETDGDLKGTTYKYTIVSKRQSELTIEMWGISVLCRKVPDSTINKYIK